MSKKMTGQIIGGVLVIIAIILVIVQHFQIYNLYGDESNKWYFYGLVGLIGLIGIIIAAWSTMSREEAQSQPEPAKQGPSQDH